MVQPMMGRLWIFVDSSSDWYCTVCEDRVSTFAVDFKNQHVDCGGLCLPRQWADIKIPMTEMMEVPTHIVLNLVRNRASSVMFNEALVDLRECLKNSKG